MARRKLDHPLIGGEVACATCADERRARGAAGTITRVGCELDARYRRAPLTYAARTHRSGPPPTSSSLTCLARRRRNP